MVKIILIQLSRLIIQVLQELKRLVTDSKTLFIHIRSASQSIRAPHSNGLSLEQEFHGICAQHYYIVTPCVSRRTLGEESMYVATVLGSKATTLNNIQNNRAKDAQLDFMAWQDKTSNEITSKYGHAYPKLYTLVYFIQNFPSWK